MTTMFLTMLSLGAILGADPSAPVNAVPKTPAPRFGTAVINADDEIEVRYCELIPYWENRVRTMTRGGGNGEPPKTEETAYRVRRYEARPATEKRGPGKFRVFTGGRELDEKARAALLKQARPVVFVEGDSRPDLTYLNLLKDDTVVVVLSPLVTPEAKPAGDTPKTK